MKFTPDIAPKKIEPKKDSRFLEIPLAPEELNLPAQELITRYGVSEATAYRMKQSGHKKINNPNYVTEQERLEQNKKFLKEITPVSVHSIESALENTHEQEIIKNLINKYEFYKFYTKEERSQKKFKLLNGEELFLGDLSLLVKMFEFKLFRNNEGELMMFDKNQDKFIPFNPTNFFEQGKSFIFKNAFDKNDTSRTNRVLINSLESIAPAIFKTGFFKEEDFAKHMAGSFAYKIEGPHERKLSPNTPYAFLTGEGGSAKYYLGRDKFVGTDIKINHETTEVSVLDNTTGAVFEIVNGNRSILYTFPLITKEEYQNKEKEILERRVAQGKTIEINPSDYITIGAEEMLRRLTPYATMNFIPKNQDESDVEYAQRIARLSDISYVLGSFRSFMSETGLAANNYSWSDQLVLADVLTKVEQKDKLVSFGRKFKKDGMRTFLSIEHGGVEMGNKILELGEKLPEDTAQKVFVKYGEIIDNVNKITEFAKNNFTKEVETNPELIRKIEETLYQKGEQLLSKTHDNIKNEKELDSQQHKNLLNSLEAINSDIILFASIFKEAYKDDPDLKLSEIKNTEITVNSPIELSSEDVAKMEQIYKTNKQHWPEELLAKALAEFKNNLKENRGRFYILKMQNKIVSFSWFNDISEDRTYCGYFNVRPEARESNLGQALKKVAYRKEGRSKALECYVFEQDKELVDNYKINYGFEIEKENCDPTGTGELFYKLVRPIQNS